MKHNIKIGIFRIGFDAKTSLLQHNFRVWVTMEGKNFRAAKRRIRKNEKSGGHMIDKKLIDGLILNGQPSKDVAAAGSCSISTVRNRKRVLRKQGRLEAHTPPTKNQS